MKKKQFVNKIKNLFQKNIISVFIIALIPAAVLIYLSPFNFNKYIIELEKTQNFIYDNEIEIYEDINNDSKKEFLRFFNHYNKFAAVSIFDENMINIQQINFAKKLASPDEKNLPFCTDINNNGYKEIFFFTQNDDSLFLNIINSKKLTSYKENIFISKIGFDTIPQKDFYYQWITAEDINGDGIKEVYFGINAGFALYPRRLFRYDIKNDSLIASVNIGTKLKTVPYKNRNNSLFFMCGTWSTDNCPKNYPFSYHDTCSWIFSYDKDLKLRFKPVALKGKYSATDKIYKMNNQFWFLFYPPTKKNRLIFIDSIGKITDEIYCKERNIRLNYLKILNKPQYFMTNYSNLNTYLFNPKLKRIEKKYSLTNKVRNSFFVTSADIDQDSEPEHIFLNKKNLSFDIYRNNLKHPANFILDNNIIDNITSTSQNGISKIIIKGRDKFYFFNYFKNPEYWFRYIFWVLTYILSVLFIWIVQLIPKRIEGKQNELKNRIVNLQLKNTQNQLDPHFTFNALNVVASKIYKEDRNTAYDLFERFSRLMRSSLAFSDKIFRPLNDELQFTEDYLEFQKSRFNNLFDYEILIPENINADKIKIPKMLIQGFAENCVKHAFKGIDYKGKISITVTHPDRVNLIIEDNGIGIKQSQIENPVPESGVGMIAMQEQVSLINKLYNKEIVIDITDKSITNSISTGTIVSIQL